jgi:hypothetical protein
MLDRLFGKIKNHQIFIISSALFVYALTWVITKLTSNLIWKKTLESADTAQSLLDFFIPAFLLAGVLIAWQREKGRKWYLPGIFVLILILVAANIFIFHVKTINYGDNEQFGQLIDSGDVFSRWMLGSNILKSVYQSLWLPLALRGWLPFQHHYSKVWSLGRYRLVFFLSLFQ